MNIQELTVFVIVAIIAKMMPAILPQGGKFNAAFIIELALIDIYQGPLEALYVALISTAIGGFFSEIIDGKFTIRKIGELGLDVATKIIVVGLAGITYQLVGYKYFNFIMALIVYYSLDILFMSLRKSIDNSLPLISLLRSFGRTLILNYVLLAPLAYFMALIYISVTDDRMQIFSVLLFFVPLLLVTYSVRLYMNIGKTYEQTIKSLAATIEVRDPFMRGHSERVARDTMEIAQAMGYPNKELRLLQYVVLLHDVGNLEVEEGILKKPGPLTKKEYNEVKSHVIRGFEIISKIKFLEQAVDIIKHHHEHYDGGGYPGGLKGEDIPLGARIIAVADAFDAMTSERPYRLSKTPSRAMGEIMMLAGRQFDPKVVNCLVNILRRRGEI